MRKQYSVWSVKLHTGDKAECIAIYHNRGHALAKLRGLRLAAWRAGSEMQYIIQHDR